MRGIPVAPKTLRRNGSGASISTNMNKRHRNVVGPEIRKLRRQLGWTQQRLAKTLRKEGFNITRSTLAKIECQLIWVGDFELFYFVRVLGVRLEHLFPTINLHVPLREVLPQNRPAPRKADGTPKAKAVGSSKSRKLAGVE